MTAKGYDDRDALYGALADHHLRIGDSQFYVPPTAITVTRKMKNEKVNVLRARGSFIKNSGYFDLVFQINLFFPDMQSINTEFRQLLAQVRKCPFLPVQNTLLNTVYQVEAVTIAGISVTSVEGFPYSLQAQLTVYKFNPYAYIYDSSERSFEEMFNWPLFRWYYQRNLKPDPKRLLTYYEPLQTQFHNDYMFKIASEEDLKFMQDWRIKRNKLIQKWMQEKGTGLTSDTRDYTYAAGIPIPDMVDPAGMLGADFGKEINESVFNNQLNDLYKENPGKVLNEYDISMDNWDIPGLTLESISAGFENTITPVQLQANESPTHQYMGSQDVVFIAKFSCDDIEALTSLEQMVRRSTYLTREYHQYISNGFIQFDHQLTRLFGINFVVIEDMVTNTKEGFPGCYDVVITMSSYNRAQRRIAETQWLSQKADGLLPENAWWQQPVLFNIFSSPAFKTFDPMSPVGSLDAQQKAIYDANIKEMFKTMELYPDLELPTYTEVKNAGFKIPNWNDGQFVDPDFFLVYEDPIDFGAQLTEILKEDAKGEVRDSMNGAGSFTGAMITPDEKTQKVIEQYRQKYDTAGTNGASGSGWSTSSNSSQGVSSSTTSSSSNAQADMKNMSESDMETLIRKVADDEGVPQPLALGLALAFDSQLRQFYSTGNGTNKSIGNITVSQSNIPIMMTASNQYLTDATFAQSASYIGVMRVSPVMGNVNALSNSIEQNVTIGVSTLKFYLDQIKNGNLVNNNVQSAFGFTNSSSDTEKAQWAGAICYYLGFQREYNALYSDNKRMPASVMSLITGILNKTKSVRSIASATVQKSFDSLPIGDYKNVSMSGATYSFKETIFSEKDFADHQTVFKESFHDMQKYDHRGRLVRAFPTFFLAIVDEGQFIGTVKLSDQYFGYRAVSDISYTNNRKNASSTLALTMVNTYGNLSDATKGMDLTHTSIGDMIQSWLMPGTLASEVERNRHKDPQYYKSIYLRTGARIHFRMGYGSNPINMPTVMNGTITSIQNEGEMMTIIAQDDGIELTHKLKAAPNDQTRTLFFSAQEPVEILDELLTDHQNWFKDTASLISNAEYQKHSLGIMHFGMPGIPISHYWWQFSALNDRPVNEITMNIYSTTGQLRFQANGFWSKLGNLFGVGTSDEDGINMNLFDKTIWDVLAVTSSVGEDMVVAVHPFDFRNTIFHGKPYFPIAYEYSYNGSNVQTVSKPFRQYHIYDSWTSIVDNSIVASEDHMYNVAIGIFNNEGSMDTTQAIYVDTNIWPEKQKTVQIDTHLNAQGVRLVEHIPLIGHFLNKPMKWYFDEWTAIKIAAAGLRDHVKEMYGGYLTVMGDPSLKPYDQFYLNDTFTNMNGPAEVREVNHIMNFNVGFITMITPDVIAVNSDKNVVGFVASFGAAAAQILAVVNMRAMLRNAGFQGAYPIMNATWASVKKQWNKLPGKTKLTQMTQKIKDFATSKTVPSGSTSSIFEVDPVTGEVREYSPVTSKMKQRWQKSGILKEFLTNIKDFSGNRIADLFDSAGSSLAGKSVLGYDISKLGQLGTKMSSLMRGGIGTGLKWGARGSEFLVGGAELLMGPPGWVALLIETIIINVLLSGIAEFIDRFTFTRKAVMIAPLYKDGVEFTAGINGHMGSVVGDSPDAWQALLNSWLGQTLLGFLGSNANEYGAATNSVGMGTEASSTPEQFMSTFATNFFNEHRKRVIVNPQVQTQFENDMQAAHEDMNKLKSDLDTLQQKRADYGKETRKLFSLDTLTSWVKGLFDGWWNDKNGTSSSSGISDGLNQLFQQSEQWIAKGTSAMIYVYGGGRQSTWEAFVKGGQADCSSYTMQMFKHFLNINLSSTAQGQWADMTGNSKVNKDSLQAGDLVFFCSDGTGKATHVGIYYQNNEFYNMTETGQPLTKSNLTTSWHVKYWLGAKRYAGVGATVNSGQFISMDLNVPSGISADAINKTFAGTGLAGTGQLFKNVESNIVGGIHPLDTSGRKISALYLAAHAAWETGYGSSRIFRDKNNLFGYGAVDSNPYNGAYKFASVQDCIYYAADKIKTNYLTAGGKYYHGPNLTGMNVTYATDQNWKNGIAAIMAKIAKNDPNFKLSSDGKGVSAASIEMPDVTIMNTDTSSTMIQSSSQMIDSPNKGYSNNQTDAPSGTDYAPYRLTPGQARMQLLNLQEVPHPNVDLVNASEFYLRQESYLSLMNLALAYKQITGSTIQVVSCWKDTDDWHGTGYAVDLACETMNFLAGSYRLPKGSKEKSDLQNLIDCGAAAGFDGILNADPDVIKAMKQKYPNKRILAQNKYFNRVQFSYPANER